MGSEYVVHQSLEGRWRICEHKGHDKELKEALMSPERRFGDVFRMHAHLVITRAQVQLCEEAGALELIQ
jgi:hypothetical protein